MTEDSENAEKSIVELREMLEKSQKTNEDLFKTNTSL